MSDRARRSTVSRIQFKPRPKLRIYGLAAPSTSQRPVHAKLPKIKRRLRVVRRAKRAFETRWTRAGGGTPNPTSQVLSQARSLGNAARFGLLSSRHSASPGQICLMLGIALSIVLSCQGHESSIEPCDRFKVVEKMRRGFLKFPQAPLAKDLGSDR